MSHLEREIHEQPQVIRRLLTESVDVAEEIAAAIRAFDPAFVLIAARGTSDNAARYAQYCLGIHARMPVALAAPSIHTLYDAAPNLARALVIGVSQSGQSEDVRRVISDARSQGALTVSITNDPDSPLASGAAYHLPILAGPERSVAATKTYTAELTAIAMLVSALADDPALATALQALPDHIATTLDASAAITGWVQRYRYMEQFAVIGRGYNYATAFEISLKVKELCYLSGVEYSEADFRHGPIAMINEGFPVILVAPSGKTFPYLLDLMQRLNEKQAECLVISNDAACQQYARYVMPIADTPEWLSPIAAVVPGQLFAMRLAEARNLDIDNPRHLQKVTVTR